MKKVNAYHEEEGRDGAAGPRRALRLREPRDVQLPGFHGVRGGRCAFFCPLWLLEPALMKPRVERLL